MKILKAYKNNIGTILINSKSEIVSFYPINLSQPHGNLKTITHNSFKYCLEWIKPKTKEAAHWYNQTMYAVSKKLYKTYFNSETKMHEKLKSKMLIDTKNTPIEINFINDYQFSVKLKTTFKK